MRALLVALVGVVALAAPASATTSTQAERAIGRIRHELVLIQQYSEGKRPMLARRNCELLRDHAAALAALDKPARLRRALWSSVLAAAREYELAGQACVDLRLPDFVTHLVRGGDHVRATRAISLQWGRLFGHGAIDATYPEEGT